MGTVQLSNCSRTDNKKGKPMLIDTVVVIDSKVMIMNHDDVNIGEERSVRQSSDLGFFSIRTLEIGWR